MNLNKTIVTLSLLSSSFLCMGMDNSSDNLLTTTQITYPSKEEVKKDLFECMSSIASARANFEGKKTNIYLLPQTTETPNKSSKVLQIIAQKKQPQENLVRVDLNTFYSSFK